MKKIAVVVEGVADVLAIPSLVVKAAAAFDQQIFACDPPIRAGEAKKLMREGELERFLELAASREDAEAVIVLVDLDDLCAAKLSKDFYSRSAKIAEIYKKSIDVCFIIREYECWFLHSIEKNGILYDTNFPNPQAIRGAKQALSRTCLSQAYKEVRDQPVMTKHLDFKKLTQIDRSFRKFAKSLTGLSYEELDQAFQHHT